MTNEAIDPRSITPWRPRHLHPPNARCGGMTLIELMVATAIGTFLVGGAITVFTHGQAAGRVNESVARLQENARLALALLETDIRMAGYLGLTSHSSDIDNRAAPAQSTPPGLAVRNDCENNWAINLDVVVAGTNNGFGWNTCAPYKQVQPDADTLVIRRTSADWTSPGDIRPGTLYVQSGRFGQGYIFLGGTTPATPPPAGSRSFQLLTRGYYVGGNSSLDAPGNPVPSLRMKTLSGSSRGPGIMDQEVLPGVEDLQIQLGVDTNRAGQPGWGSVNRYLNPDDPALNPADPEFLPEARVLAVRIWLRMRAERPEQGHLDTREYEYADRHLSAMDDQFRRTMVSRTIRLRNARSSFR